MEVQPLFARNQRERLFEVGAELVGVPRAARIVAGHGEAAVEGGAVFEAGDVVALPAVKADRNLVEPVERRFDIDAEIGIDFFRRIKHGSHTHSP